MILQDLVSVCVPTYNGAAYIKETIDCIITQTYQNLEIIINDDCSSDLTAIIVEEMAKNDSRIKFYVNNENLGLVGNWNKCIELSNGKWIKFLFQDDLMSSDCISKMIDCKMPFVIASRKFFFDKNTDLKTRKTFEKIEYEFSISKIIPNISSLSSNLFVTTFCKFPSVNIFGEPSSMLIRKDIFSTVGYFDPKVKQICDLEFWLRVGSHFGASIMKEDLISFRVHSDSMSSNNHSNKRLETLYKDYFIVYDKIINNNEFQKFRDLAGSYLDFLLWEYSKKVMLLQYAEPKSDENRIKILQELEHSNGIAKQFVNQSIKCFTLKSLKLLFIAPRLTIYKLAGMCLAVIKRTLSKFNS